MTKQEVDSADEIALEARLAQLGRLFERDEQTREDEVEAEYITAKLDMLAKEREIFYDQLRPTRL